MKFRNLLSLSAVTLMSLGLTMGATELSASAATPATPTPATPTSTNKTINATTTTITLNSVASAVNSNSNWKVSSNNIGLGDFNFNISNGTHSNFTRNVSAKASDLTSAGHTSIPVNVNLGNNTSSSTLLSNDGNVNPNIPLKNVSLDLQNPNQNLGLSENSTASYSTNLTWTLDSANVKNPGK